MRRLALLAIALVSLAGLAGVAHATSHTRSAGAPTAASLRQEDAEPTPDDIDGDTVPNAKDQCPDQFGTRASGGCPDADGDGSPDSIDKCPDEVAASADGTGQNDGCYVEVFSFNAYLPGRHTPGTMGTDIADQCGGEPHCVISGTAVVSVSRSVAHELGLSSTRIGSFDFGHCSQYNVCIAKLNPSAAITKKLKAADKRIGHDGAMPVYVPVNISFEMTSPRKETVTDTYRFGLGTNGGQYRVCGAGFSPAHYKTPACGGKHGGDGEG